MAENTAPEPTNREWLPRIIVQGGASSLRGVDIETKPFLTGVKESATRGNAILTGGGTAVDAVEAAIRVMEDNELFNAGYGSYLNNSGEVECDAMIMDGHTLANGAVMTGRRFRNPVSLAKKIMEESCHCALSGDGALDFARQKDVPLCEPENLISPRARAKNVKYEDFDSFVKHKYPGTPVSEQGDTVTAIAMDANGHLACATSTGGIAGRLRGRVSDAALVGCGGYANEHGAATITGQGELIMKMTLARDVVYRMENGKSAQESAENALRKMKTRFNELGCGGVIAIDQHGNFGKACTTEFMPWASIVESRMECGRNAH